MFSFTRGAGAGSGKKIPGAGAAPKQAGFETLLVTLSQTFMSVNTVNNDL